jgi:hypothetical protein
MEQKPNSMSHRDWFVKQLAKILDIYFDFVDEVI